MKVHILVAKAFIPNPEKKPFVNHIDGIKTNCKLSNLEWSTHQENVDHAGENGLRAIGSCNGQSKLNDEQVMEIKRLLMTTDLMQKEIAQKYNIGTSVISNIKTGRAWKHLQID